MPVRICKITVQHEIGRSRSFIKRIREWWHSVISDDRVVSQDDQIKSRSLTGDWPLLLVNNMDCTQFNKQTDTKHLINEFSFHQIKSLQLICGHWHMVGWTLIRQSNTHHQCFQFIWATQGVKSLSSLEKF